MKRTLSAPHAGSYNELLAAPLRQSIRDELWRVIRGPNRDDDVLLASMQVLIPALRACRIVPSVGLLQE
jgi:hypothetical protein